MDDKFLEYLYVTGQLENDSKKEEEVIIVEEDEEDDE